MTVHPRDVGASTRRDRRDDMRRNVATAPTKTPFTTPKAKRSGPTPTPEARPDHEAKADKLICPACGSRVASIDASLTADAGPSEIDAVRADRHAAQRKRQGYLAESWDDADLAERIRTRDAAAAPETQGVTPGADTCCACGTSDVTVDDSRLSMLGKRVQARRRAQADAAEMSELRRGSAQRLDARRRPGEIKPSAS